MSMTNDKKPVSAAVDALSSKISTKNIGSFARVLPCGKSPWRLVCALCILVFVGAAWLWVFGEPFFSLTRRLPAQVLVVEGWIGNDGIRAAAAEFARGGYEYIVTTGGLTKDRESPSNYADMAGQELVQCGVQRDRIIVAPTGEIEHERTFKSAVATWRALQERGIHPRAINVLTLGPHARRSQLVYTKVYAPVTQAGIIAWSPAYYHTQPWWRSSRRTKCFLREIIGYPFEALLNSGRFSNSPG
jgi:hypothetical protein